MFARNRCSLFEILLYLVYVKNTHIVFSFDELNLEGMAGKLCLHLAEADLLPGGQPRRAVSRPAQNLKVEPTVLVGYPAHDVGPLRLHLDQPVVEGGVANAALFPADAVHTLGRLLAPVTIAHQAVGAEAAGEADGVAVQGGTGRVVAAGAGGLARGFAGVVVALVVHQARRTLSGYNR